MNLRQDREIATTGSPLVPFDFLQSLFIAELLRPSGRLWISSPWISDVELVDNRARQFGTLCPDWPAARVRLSRVLESLLERGTSVTIVLNDSPHNDEFLERLQSLRRVYGDSLVVKRSATLHEKGIVGDWFSLSGSMNLTYNGVYVNEERLVYTCDPERVKERRVSLEYRWEHEA